MSGKKVKHSVQILKLKDHATHCYYCLKEFSSIVTDKEDVKTIDHFVPLYLGGENRGFNKVICCYRCNGYKSNYSPQEFLNLVERGLAGEVKVKHRAYYPDEVLINIRKAILKLLWKRSKGKIASSGYYIIIHKHNTNEHSNEREEEKSIETNCSCERDNHH